MINWNPKHIEKIDDGELKITWEDGHVSQYNFRELRKHCPCALCRDEASGEPLLDPETIPKDLGATRADLVGNYALTFRFSDGHGTGIYSFENLRRLCLCAECSYHPGSETN